LVFDHHANARTDVQPARSFNLLGRAPFQVSYVVTSIGSKEASSTMPAEKNTTEQNTTVGEITSTRSQKERSGAQTGPEPADFGWG